MRQSTSNTDLEGYKQPLWERRHSPKQKAEQLAMRTIPRDCCRPLDILSGRGGSKRDRNQLGNKLFNSLIEENLELYYSRSSRRERSAVVNSVVERATHQGCRFLTLVGDVSNHYAFMTTKQIRDKVSHAFKQAERAMKRKHEASRECPEKENFSVPPQTLSFVESEQIPRSVSPSPTSDIKEEIGEESVPMPELEEEGLDYAIIEFESSLPGIDEDHADGDGTWIDLSDKMAYISSISVEAMLESFCANTLLEAWQTEPCLG